ncbi:MAG: hypothetical protein ACRYGA_16860 [Janthinobacterium lividum]
MKKNTGLTALCMAAALSACAFQAPPPDDTARDGRPPPHEHRGPPPEFVEACANRAEGTPLQITGRRGEALDGTCVPGPDGVLAFRPSRPPQR